MIECKNCFESLLIREDARTGDIVECLACRQKLQIESISRRHREAGVKLSHFGEPV